MIRPERKNGKKNSELREHQDNERGKTQKEHDLELKLKEKLLEKSRQFEELEGEMREVELRTHELEQEKSKLNERIEEEQTSNSRDRENLEKEWKTKLEKEKRKHDVELEQLK